MCFVVVIVVGLFALLALVALVGLVTLIALTLVALIILFILIPVLVSIRYPSCFFLTQTHPKKLYTYLCIRARRVPPAVTRLTVYRRLPVYALVLCSKSNTEPLRS